MLLSLNIILFLWSLFYGNTEIICPLLSLKLHFSLSSYCVASYGPIGHKFMLLFCPFLESHWMENSSVKVSFSTEKWKIYWFHTSWWGMMSECPFLCEPSMNCEVKYVLVLHTVEVGFRLFPVRQICPWLFKWQYCKVHCNIQTGPEIPVWIEIIDLIGSLHRYGHIEDRHVDASAILERPTCHHLQ